VFRGLDRFQQDAFSVWAMTVSGMCVVLFIQVLWVGEYPSQL
jgi:hypothetical protein